MFATCQYTCPPQACPSPSTRTGTVLCTTRTTCRTMRTAVGQTGRHGGGVAAAAAVHGQVGGGGGGVWWRGTEPLADGPVRNRQSKATAQHSGTSVESWYRRKRSSKSVATANRLGSRRGKWHGQLPGAVIKARRGIVRATSAALSRALLLRPAAAR